MTHSALSGSPLGRRSLLAIAGLATAYSSLVHSFQGQGAINIEDYGASVDQSPDRNLAAFRNAIAATPTGGALLIPQRDGGTYHVDTSGGLSHALVINRPMTILLNGTIRASHGKSGTNPPYIFAIDAPDVHFGGEGTIAGPGHVDDFNTLDDTRHAGLIRVTGDRFRFVGPTVRDVPKIGIHLWRCRGATITARWKGGIRNYSVGHTGLFGIRATGGGEHRITNNRFERDEQGRRLITGYFAGGLMGATRGDEITGNVADVHEKLAYLHTDSSRIADCRVVDALRTDALRVIGSDNIVERIVAERVKGGVSIYNGARNTVRDCIFREVRQAGVFVSFLGEYRAGHVGTIVTGNTIIAAADATSLQDGVCLYLGAGDTSGIAVTDNHIEATGAAFWRNGIRVEAIPPFFAERMALSGNIVGNAVNGLSLRRLKSVELERNQVTRLRGGEAVLRITS